MKRLESVTLLGVDCVDIERLEHAAKICQEKFTFAQIKLLTSCPSENEHVIQIPHLASTRDYSKFIITQLEQYVTTPHVLIIQYDGFILNPDAWSDEFLNYDYIGAPWLVDRFYVERFNFPKELAGSLVVGNGGFSVRSKKFISTYAALEREGALTEYHPEDTAACVYNRALFEARGVTFAPVELAKRFSFERKNDEYTAWDGQFGFHGRGWTDISKWRAKHPEHGVSRPRG